MSEGNRSCKPTGFSRGYLTELEAKRLKLRQFLEKVGDSSDLDVKLLRKQAQVMADYALILEARIKLDDGKKE